MVSKYENEKTNKQKQKKKKKKNLPSVLKLPKWKSFLEIKDELG